MRSTTKKVLPALLVVALAALSLPAMAQTLKIGVFDPQRITEETAIGKQVQGELEAYRNGKQADLTAQEKSIGEMQAQLEKQALSLSLDKRADLEVGIQRKILELNALKDLATRELQLEAAAAEARFNMMMGQIVEQFGRDEGFSLIFDRGAVAWASPTVDVTTALIDAFDKVFPAGADAP